MIVFVYDRSFDGLLTVVFEAWRRRKFPELLLGAGEAAPLLATELVEIQTDPVKAGRVWAGLEKKLSRLALRQLLYAWLTEENGAALEVVGYTRAVFSGVAETNFAHPDILALRQTALKVSREKHHLIQFVRFQKTAEGVYFAAVNPIYNVLPLALDFFSDRFADQPWVIYDANRQYGFYYDLEKLEEIDFYKSFDPQSGRLREKDLAEGEVMLQKAWQAYYESVSIPERTNPRLQRQYMPRRFWGYLTEKQPLDQAQSAARNKRAGSKPLDQSESEE